MTIEEHISYWFETASEDIKVAENLLENGYFTWAMFIGHLILEKSLKAYWVFIHKETPPKIHDLITLSKSCGLELDDDLTKFFYIMNKFQLEARYPDYKRETSKLADSEFAKNKLNKIIDTSKWLKSLTK